MSLPPGFLDELRGRLSLAQVVGRKVMWDNRKSNQGKGDMWAPCPFHQEKTASFHVDDRKGYYYCFGCHAKGDAISFVRETENVDFIEAVRILAGEAGLQLPERDPQAQAKADRRSQLVEVMEQAVQFYRLQLKTNAGAAARDYLAGRGLDAEAIERWELGFAPQGWQNLSDHLKSKGVDPQLMLAAGLVRPSDKGREPYDTFRDRIMFPIRDARGRAIAFGGRAMDPNDNAKYLNSPETELFDKSRCLYNHGPAREAAGKGAPLIVAEGYMDVIALSEAGFKAAVAPLGTAITDHQLALLWRISPEPHVMLDGDLAGQRAAGRLVDLALPALNDGNSLFFVGLPDGQDPDDFLKSAGADALGRRIEDERVALVLQLWRQEFGLRPTDTPEQKADLDKRLRSKIKLIPDPDVRRHYGEAIKAFRWEAFRPPNWSPEYAPKRRSASRSPMPSAKSSFLASNVDPRSLYRLSDRIVAAIAVTNPDVASQFRDGLERFEPADEAARTVLDVCVGLVAEDKGDDLPDRVRSAAGPSLYDSVFSDPLVALQPCVRKKVDADIVLHELTHHIALVTAKRSAEAEREEAEEDLDAFPSETIDLRLKAATSALDNAMRGGTEDKGEYETSETGVRVSRQEKDAFEDLLARIKLNAPSVAPPNDDDQAD